jgi:hypothetical protein
MVKSPTKTDTIDLEAKYFLNADGLDYCLKNRIPVRDLLGRDMGRSSGFEWRSCRVETLSRLVSGGFLSAVEATRPEFVTVRESLVKLAGVVLTGLLLSRFRADLWRRVSSDSSIASLAHLLRDGGPSGRKAAAVRLGSGARLDELRSAIGAECAGAVATSGSVDEDGEPGARCARLIAAIDEELLRMLALAGAAPVGAVAQIVLAYAGRMGVAEYLSLILVEIIQLAEKSYLHNLAERDRYVRTHPQELQRLLATPSFRERLMEIAAIRGESMLLRVDLSPPLPGAGSLRRMDISTRTRGLIGYGSRYDVLNGKAKAVRTMDLAALLSFAAGNDAGAKLGLVYYSNLAEACAKVGMLFSSSVVLDERKDETVASMSVTV